MGIWPLFSRVKQLNFSFVIAQQRASVMKWKWSLNIQFRFSVDASLSLIKHTFKGRFGVHRSRVRLPRGFSTGHGHLGRSCGILFWWTRCWRSQGVSCPKLLTPRMLVQYYSTGKTTLWQDRAVIGMALISFHSLMGAWHEIIRHCICSSCTV